MNEPVKLRTFFIMSALFSTEDNLRAVDAVTGRPIDKASVIADFNRGLLEADVAYRATDLRFDVQSWRESTGLSLEGRTVDILTMGYWVTDAYSRVRYETAIYQASKE